ncbi:hypothetical protein DEU56DRAFT_902375 [Suillus clintonianus]|uniref:uncharacterized protein n=1 Tax=Suillus clintonianus TaxID=1904413 RepID=UPI001B85C234|nr:uncharacterized protein DEU56DRAFT_902375 [Suillus clintonianus]KAG2132062.1 hypothetical protein DEU56DRAFT_902375 [Suillus clintonianus]
MACLISPSCPFQTPISTILRMLRIDRVLLLIFRPASRHFQQLTTSVRGVLQRLVGTLGSRWTWLSEALRGHVRAVGAFARRYLPRAFATLRDGLRFFVPRSSTNVVDSEAQSLDQNQDVVAENTSVLEVDLDLPHVPTSDLDAPSIKWLLETSTDPEVFLAAASIVPQVEWPLDLDVSDMLPQLYDIFMSCVDTQRKIIPSLKEKASACTLALSHLYCGRVLQAHPGRGEFLRPEGGRDFIWFHFMMQPGTCTADNTVLGTTGNICLMEDSETVFVPFPVGLQACPDSVPEWLSHVLPYHFITGRANEGGEKLAITVISKLLCSPSSPSTQIIANCTLLACVMVGVQIDKKDIIRVDKSSALEQLAETLLTQFQKALWACDGGNINGDNTAAARRAWKLLDVICRILELAGYYPPSFHTMRNLEACRKVYSRARSSEQSDPSALLAALRKVLHFTFAAARVPRDPDLLWYAEFLQGDSHSPDDSDWLVDYLDYIYIDSGDHETIYDVLLLLGGITVRCSPAKQHVFIERLIACMDSNMPDHIRHAALHTAYSFREDMASIDAMDDAMRDAVLTKLSPAILSVVYTPPSPTPANDDPHHSFNNPRDLCYLKLVFALAGNSDWHPHLCRDHHIDQCISLIAEYCKPDDEHPFYIAGILLRIASEKTAVTPLDSFTEQQWWDVMRSAWSLHYSLILDDRYFEFLPILVEGTKRYMQIASKSDLPQFIGKVDDVLNILERRQMRRIRGLAQAPQGEGVAIAAVKDLRTVARDTLERFVLERAGLQGNQGQTSVAGGDGSVYAGPTTTCSSDYLRARTPATAPGPPALPRRTCARSHRSSVGGD